MAYFVLCAWQMFCLHKTAPDIEWVHLFTGLWYYHLQFCTTHTHSTETILMYHETAILITCTPCAKCFTKSVTTHTQKRHTRYVNMHVINDRLPFWLLRYSVTYSRIHATGIAASAAWTVMILATVCISMCQNLPEHKN